MQASLEWTPKDPVPLPSGNIDGVPVDLGLFRACQNAVAAAGTAADAQLSAILSGNDMQRSIRQVEDFISSFDRLPGLNALLHGPVLGKGTTAELLPVKPLRELGSTTHLRAADSSIAGFLSRLPSISAAGIAAPAAARLVRPELVQVYVDLASSLEELSAGFKGQPGPAAAGPQLRLLHYSQVAFGRLDMAWQKAQEVHLLACHGGSRLGTAPSPQSP